MQMDLPAFGGMCEFVLSARETPLGRCTTPAVWRNFSFVATQDIMYKYFNRSAKEFSVEVLCRMASRRRIALF